MLKILRIKEAVRLESMSVRQKLKHGGMVGEGYRSVVLR